MLTAKIYKKFKQRRYRKIGTFLEKSQFWPREKVLAYQFEKIKNIITHAYNHVPYYRKIFKELGATPADIVTHEDFAGLPVLTKEIIRANFNDLIADNISENQLKPNATGGSTGEPLHFFQDDNFELWADAARNRGWYGIAGCNSWDKCAVVWGAMHEIKRDFSLWERFYDLVTSGDILLNAFNLSNDRKIQFIRLCNLVKPVLLRGYTTAIDDLAVFLEENDLFFPPLKGIILCAETVDEHTQAYIEKVFKAPSYNTYGGRELSLIGMECSAKNGLHEISENNYVEFEPVELSGYNDAGNLLITNLNNFAMPFIRYRIGDIGVPSNQTTCECGRGLPLIKKVIGRTTEVFWFYDGTRIAGEMFIHLMKDFPLKEYQFLQTSPKSVVLLHKGTDLTDSRIKEKIVRTYQGYLPVGVDFSFQEVSGFEKTVTGKFRFVKKDFSV